MIRRARINSKGKSDYYLRRICPSTRKYHLGSHWRDFHQASYCGFLWKSINKMQISWKPEKKYREQYMNSYMCFIFPVAILPQNRIPLKSYHYRPQGRRTIGRPKKRWREQLELWRRNGSKGPILDIYDDDEYLWGKIIQKALLCFHVKALNNYYISNSNRRTYVR